MDIKEICEQEYKRGFVAGIKEAETVRTELEDTKAMLKTVDDTLADAVETIKELREKRDSLKKKLEETEARKDEVLVRYANLKQEAEDLQHRHDRLQDIEVAEAKLLEEARREIRMLRRMVEALLGEPVYRKPFVMPKVEIGSPDWGALVRLQSSIAPQVAVVVVKEEKG